MKTYRSPIGSAKTTSLVLGLLVATSMAGCLGTEDLPVVPFSQYVGSFDGTYTWAPLVVHDGNGTQVPLEAALGNIGEPPRVVQTRPGGLGYNPHIAVNPQTGAVFLTQPDLLHQKDDRVLRSEDQGRTWNIAHELRSPNYPESYDRFHGGGHSVWADPETGRVFASYNQPDYLCRLLARSDADGVMGSWSENLLACNNPTPSGWVRMTTVPPAPGAPLGPGALPVPAGDEYPNVVYQCMLKTLRDRDPAENAANPPLVVSTPVEEDLTGGATCGVSLDGGTTFAWENLAHTSNCLVLPGRPVGFPDGTVALPMGTAIEGCRVPPAIAVSDDHGTSWTTRTCMGAGAQVEVEPGIGVSDDGTAYFVYRDGDHTIRLARSTDAFRSCETFQLSPPDHTLNVFTAIAVGDDGRIAVAYLATKDVQEDGAAPHTAAPESDWHLFVTTSFNADSEDPVFLTQQVTPMEDPVQIGCIWALAGTDARECHNLGLLISLASDAEGRFYVAFVDGCTPRTHCSGDPFQSDYQTRDRELALAVLDSGEGLRGSVTPLGMEHPQPYDRVLATGATGVVGDASTEGAGPLDGSAAPGAEGPGGGVLGRVFRAAAGAFSI